MKQRRYFILLFSVLVVLTVCGLIVARTQAAYWGRASGYGYFDNQFHGYGYHQSGWPDNGYILPPGALDNVNSVSGLVSTLQYYYNQGNPWYSTVSFIVDTMLGRNGGVPKGVTAADWATITSRLNAVSIDWSNPSFSTPYNTYHMATNINRNVSANDAGWATSGQGPSRAIVMTNPSNPAQIYYALFKSCANPVGGVPGLPAAPPIGTVDVANCSTVAGWAFDPNNSGASIEVDAYYGGPAGSGAPGVGHIANVSRPDVKAAYGIGGNHGFSFANDYSNATTATNVYIYAISSTGAGNPLIGIKSYGPCTHAATLTPTTTATPSGWINPSDNESFVDRLQISNYGGTDHIVKLSEYRSLNGGASYTLIRSDGVLAANSNRTQDIWAWTPTAAEKTNSSICERMVITDAGGASYTATVSQACVNIRSGKTTPVVQTNPQYIQQGESSTINGVLDKRF